MLAMCARIPQSQINKIFNERIYNINIMLLIAICLALQLTRKEADDLLARAERAISPADPSHDTYYELIDMYSKMEPPITEEEICNFLCTADEILEERNLLPLYSDLL